MAEQAEVDALRRMINDTAEPYTYSDEELGAYIDAAGLNGAAATVWQEYAAKASSLVNVSESGSSRSMQQVHQNAMAMANYYSKLATDESSTDPTSDPYPYTVAIERP